MRGGWGEFILCPMCISGSISTKCQIEHVIGSSGFSSTRTNLSPFTKDFRGGKQVNESMDEFFVALPCGGACHQEMQTASNVRLIDVREWTRSVCSARSPSNKSRVVGSAFH